MSEQRLAKIVYTYNIMEDNIVARHFYDNGTDDVQKHDRKEWEDLLYDIRRNQPGVIIRTAAQEIEDV